MRLTLSNMNCYGTQDPQTKQNKRFQEIRSGAVSLYAGAGSNTPVGCAEEALGSGYQDIRFGALRLCKTK